MTSHHLGWAATFKLGSCIECRCLLSALSQALILLLILLFCFGILLLYAQLKMLVTKKEATSPFYLSLACEELRVFGVFEKVGAFHFRLGQMCVCRQRKAS